MLAPTPRVLMAVSCWIQLFSCYLFTSSHRKHSMLSHFKSVSTGACSSQASCPNIYACFFCNPSLAGFHTASVQSFECMFPIIMKQIEATQYCWLSP